MTANTKQPENPPAFPEFCINSSDIKHKGILLRDYMAGQALVGYLTRNGLDFKCISGLPPDILAENSYKIADAMLLERLK